MMRSSYIGVAYLLVLAAGCASTVEYSEAPPKGYCTWMAQDGTKVECWPHAGLCKGPAGSNWCNRCICNTPAVDGYTCSSEPCLAPPTCSTSGPVFFGGGCTFTYNLCDDDHVYQVNCGGPGSVCECRVQFQGMFKYGAQTTTNLCSTAAAEQLTTFNQLCGWAIQLKK